MSGRGRTLRLATRTSTLARRQAEQVAAALENRRYAVELVEVEATGDRVRDELIHELGTTGAFVRALDEQVLEGAVDGAIHSMKDVPTEGGDELVVAAVLERGPAADVLVTPDGETLPELPAGATVGTGSLRREAQLLAERPDLTVAGLRGNVDTRIEKLLAPHLQAERAARESDREASEDEADPVAEWVDALAPIERRALDRTVETTYDAVVLAAAGLDRLDLLGEVSSNTLPPAEFVPAPGQGAIAVTMGETEAARSVNDAIDDPRTRVAVTVERTVLAELGGGCLAPLGVHAVLRGECVDTTVRVLDRDGERTIEASAELPVDRHRAAARELARDLADDGATDIVRTATRTVTEP